MGVYVARIADYKSVSAQSLVLVGRTISQHRSARAATGTPEKIYKNTRYIPNEDQSQSWITEQDLNTMCAVADSNMI